MVAVDQAELASWLYTQGIPNAFAVGPPEPALLGEFPLEIAHVLSGRDADAGEQRIGEDQLADAGAEVVDGLQVGLVGGDAVLPLGAEGEDVPGEQVHANAPVRGVLHDLAPEPDLVLDRHRPNGLEVGESLRAHHVIAAVRIGFVQADRGALDVGERHVGILGHFHHRREGVEAPQREHVVAVARHLVEELAPEVERPHLGDVGLRRVGVVRVARRAGVERGVELDAALLDAGRMIGVAETGQRPQPQGFGDVEAAVHGAGGVGGEDRDRVAPAARQPANAIGLLPGGAKRRHAELLRKARGLRRSPRPARCKESRARRSAARRGSWERLARRCARSPMRQKRAAGRRNRRIAPAAAANRRPWQRYSPTASGLLTFV